MLICELIDPEAGVKRPRSDRASRYLIHAPFFARSDTELQEAWAEMEKVKKSGKAKSIGVSNYLKSHLTAILATATIPPSINQIEYHPYLQHGDLIPFQKNHDIATAAYGPLIPVTKAKPGPCDTILEDLARKYNVSEGEIALRWCIEQGIVTITTSGKEERLRDYLRALAITLTPEEMSDIAGSGAQKHFRGFWQKKFAADDRS